MKMNSKEKKKDDGEEKKKKRRKRRGGEVRDFGEGEQKKKVFAGEGFLAGRVKAKAGKCS